MSRIFAAVTLATVMLLGVAVLSAAYEDVDSDATAFEDITEIFATSIELTMLVPIALLIGLLLAALGVLAR